MRAAYLRLLPFDPRKFHYAHLAALEQRLRQTILKQRDSSPLPPVIWSFEPAPIYMVVGSKDAPGPKDGRRLGILEQLTSMLRSPNISHGLESGQVFELGKQFRTLSWRGDPEAEKKDRPRDWKKGLRDFKCEPDIVPLPHRKRSKYYGPGQVVVWPVLDLESGPLATRTTVQIERALGSATISTLRKMYGIANAFQVRESGVWVDSKTFRERRLIADIHVEAKDGVSTFGVALNVETPLDGDTVINPWDRLHQARLGVHKTTSVAAELGVKGCSLGRDDRVDLLNTMEALSRSLASELRCDLAPTTPEEVFGDDWNSLGAKHGRGDGGWRSWRPTVIPIPDFFFFM